MADVRVRETMDKAHRMARTQSHLALGITMEQHGRCRLDDGVYKVDVLVSGRQ